MHELWDTSVGRLMGAYADEAEPLRIVVMFAEDFGDDDVENLTLLQSREDGSSGGSESGGTLLARARRQGRAATGVSARSSECATHSSGHGAAALPMAATRAK